MSDVFLKGKQCLQHEVSNFDFSIHGSGCKDVCAWAISPESDRTGIILRSSMVLLHGPGRNEKLEYLY